MPSLQSVAVETVQFYVPSSGEGDNLVLVEVVGVVVARGEVAGVVGDGGRHSPSLPLVRHLGSCAPLRVESSPGSRIAIQTRRARRRGRPL